MILLFLEKICEAIYFSLFLIYGKNIKEKRILLTAIMIFEYLALKYFISFNVWFQLSYTFLVYITLKVLYKDKAQITDIFLFAGASIILIFISFLCGLILFYNIDIYLYVLIFNRILLFLLLLIFKNKISKIYNKIISFWNRKNKSTKISSLTVRNISIVIFNLMFYIINIGMIIALYIIETR